MTATADEVQTEVVETPETSGEESEGSGDGRGRKKDRDFEKFSELHQEIADYVNANSGLAAVTPNQVKAVLILKTDFNNLPENAEKRAKRKAEIAEQKKQFEGMSDAQIKATKAAARADAQAAKMEARVQEAREKAAKLRAAAEAGGDDLAALVESQQAEASEAPKKRGIGRGRKTPAAE